MNRWSFQQAQEIFHSPFLDIVYNAQAIHREHFTANTIQASALMTIKTGGCPEDCAYCPQAARHDTGLPYQPLSDVAEVIKAARLAQSAGATRFCMGAAWRGPTDRQIDSVCEMIRAVKALGLETCVTLGLLTAAQAKKLKEAGLDFYNHNIDSSEDFYGQIITTRTFKDRLQTLEYVRNAGIAVCCGGILGMGETNDDRIEMLRTLANLEVPPESITINQLIPIPGTPLEHAPPPDPFDVVRTIALARHLMPQSWVRLSAGRTSMSETLQALCFLAGANSIFYGEKLLTADNPSPQEDDDLFHKLGLIKASSERMRAAHVE